jgi:hypothetical protein
MGVIDKYRFESHGASGCSNSAYHLDRTTCCGGYCVEDDELHGLYFDPADLTRHIDLWDTKPCPLCGAVEWELVEVSELADVPAAWRWAC